eukprot:scaffold28522_cov101-Isochrysis_galbana.AAC.2
MHIDFTTTRKCEEEGVCVEMEMPTQLIGTTPGTLSITYCPTTSAHDALRHPCPQLSAVWQTSRNCLA